MLSYLWLLLLTFALATAGQGTSNSLATARWDKQCSSSPHHKPRIFVLTDISNEPDDQMSLVRFLTYSNQWSVQGIAATTSVWLNDTIDPKTIHEVIGGYGKVVDNLNVHVSPHAPYPSENELLSKVYKGHAVYGLAALDLKLSEAARKLIHATDASSKDSPLWLAVWSGASILAEAMNHVSKTRHSDAMNDFVSKLRVYSISDQDDAGPWVRFHWPKLFFVVSLHSFSTYTLSTWTGISGEEYRNFDQGGPNTALVTNEWLEEHIRVGPLGAYYLNYTFIMEGDTPSFLPVIQNGLGDIEHPEWGSWGGRYMLLDLSGRSRIYTDTVDVAKGVNGKLFTSQQATIWRWREAYQYDFAARMQWTVHAKYSAANHQPITVVNHTCGPEPLEIRYSSKSSIILDASDSWDPDGDELDFTWYHYREPTIRWEGTTQDGGPFLKIEKIGDDYAVVKVTPLQNIELHVLLILKDKRDLPLTTYRRIILKPDSE